MSSNNTQIDELFRQAFETYKTGPPANSWEKLEAALDKRDAEKYKRRFLGWKIAAMLLLVTCSVLAIHYWVDKQGGPSRPEGAVVKKVASPAKPVQELPAPSATPLQPPPVIPANTMADEATHSGPVANGYSSSTAAQPTAADDSSQGGSRVTPHLSAAGPLSVAEKTPDPVVKNQSDWHRPKSPQRAKKGVSLPPEPNAEGSYTLVAHLEHLAPRLLNQGAVYSAVPKHLPYWSAQEKTAGLQQVRLSVPHTARWSLTAYASADWNTNRLAEGQEHVRGGRDHRRDIEAHESGERSYSTGLTLTRSFNQWRVGAGLTYFQTNTTINDQQIFATRLQDGSIQYKYTTSAGYSYVPSLSGRSPSLGDTAEVRASSLRLRVVGLPMTLGYAFTWRNFSATPSVGVSLNYIAAASLRAELYRSAAADWYATNKLYGIDNFFVDGIADLSLRYRVQKNWSVLVRPAARFALTSVTQENVVKTFPIAFGIGAGLAFDF